MLNSSQKLKDAKCYIWKYCTVHQFTLLRFMTFHRRFPLERYLPPGAFTSPGEFSNNMIHGEGLWRWLDGSMHAGEAKKGKREGKGLYVNSMRVIRRLLRPINLMEHPKLDNLYQGLTSLTVGHLTAS